MKRQSKPVTILVAEDDADDRLLLQDAFKESSLNNELRFVENGEQLLDYLRRKGEYANPGEAPVAGLILLDLNMPKIDGREALNIIKNDAVLRSIPVVVLTTSAEEDDVFFAYRLGVSSYISKPVTFEGLVNVVKVIDAYWNDTVELPPQNTDGA
ncbi:MAG: response regulator [Rhodospirillales bacterium]|nr:MAG: response regulator [Rhodospirillales bacterium]